MGNFMIGDVYPPYLGRVNKIYCGHEQVWPKMYTTGGGGVYAIRGSNEKALQGTGDHPFGMHTSDTSSDPEPYRPDAGFKYPVGEPVMYASMINSLAPNYQDQLIVDTYIQSEPVRIVFERPTKEEETNDKVYYYAKYYDRYGNFLFTYKLRFTDSIYKDLTVNYISTAGPDTDMTLRFYLAKTFVHHQYPGDPNPLKTELICDVRTSEYHFKDVEKYWNEPFVDPQMAFPDYEIPKSSDNVTLLHLLSGNITDSVNVYEIKNVKRTLKEDCMPNSHNQYDYDYMYTLPGTDIGTVVMNEIHQYEPHVFCYKVNIPTSDIYSEDVKANKDDPMFKGLTIDCRNIGDGSLIQRDIITPDMILAQVPNIGDSVEKAYVSTYVYHGLHICSLGTYNHIDENTVTCKIYTYSMTPTNNDVITKDFDTVLRKQDDDTWEYDPPLYLTSWSYYDINHVHIRIVDALNNNKVVLDEVFDMNEIGEGTLYSVEDYTRDVYWYDGRAVLRCITRRGYDAYNKEYLQIRWCRVRYAYSHPGGMTMAPDLSGYLQINEDGTYGPCDYNGYCVYSLSDLYGQ